jgi:hypothetical protein
MPAPLLGHGKDARADWGQRYVGLWSQPQSRFAISRTTNGKATAGRHPSDPGVLADPCERRGLVHDGTVQPLDAGEWRPT